MASLAAAMPFLLRDEGGWSDDPADPGGATMHGVTFRTAQRLLGFTTPDQLRAITPDQLMQVYGTPDYWRYDGIQDQRVATKIFDIGVDVGLGTEVRILQKVLGVAEDGVWGPATQAATNAQDPDQLLQALCDAAKEHYIAVAQAHPVEGKFLNGWEHRAEEIPDAA
jgi:lysozyme family protein